MKEFLSNAKHSMSIWLNLIPTILIFVDLLAHEPYIPTTWIPVMYAVQGILNIFIRVFRENPPLLPSERDQYNHLLSNAKPISVSKL